MLFREFCYDDLRGNVSSLLDGEFRSLSLLETIQCFNFAK